MNVEYGFNFDDLSSASVAIKLISNLSILLTACIVKSETQISINLVKVLWHRGQLFLGPSGNFFSMEFPKLHMLDA